MIKLFSENVSTRSFESMNHLVRSVASICLNEEVNVIGTNSQGIYLPAVLFGYIVEHFFQSVRHCILENRSPSFRAPHEMNHTK